MFAQIEKVFGRRLPLATLFSAPSIELLAQRLQDAQPASGSSLVAIRSQGEGYPVFWVHTFGGHILLYQRLARYLAPNQPVYALKPVGIDDGRPPHERIEDMAAHYLSEIQAIQPAGPYSLGGQSFGGLVAFEMACQLQRRGEKISGLFILDTYAPGCDCDKSGLRRRALRLSRWLDFHRVSLRMITLKQRPAYLLERLTLLLANISISVASADGVLNIHRAHARAQVPILTASLSGPNYFVSGQPATPCRHGQPSIWLGQAGGTKESKYMKFRLPQFHNRGTQCQDPGRQVAGLSGGPRGIGLMFPTCGDATGLNVRHAHAPGRIAPRRDDSDSARQTALLI